MEYTIRERIANMVIAMTFMMLLLTNICVGTMLYVVLTHKATPEATTVPATQEQIKQTPDEMSLEVL
jgi:hypothetical protein